MTRRGLLPAVDILALAAFVVAGLIQHEDGTTPPLFLRNAAPLVVCWFVAALLTGTYRRPGLSTLLATWAVAVPIGLLVRTAWSRSPRGVEILLFVGVGLAFTLLFLLIGRGLVGLITRLFTRGDAAAQASGVVP